MNNIGEGALISPKALFHSKPVHIMYRYISLSITFDYEGLKGFLTTIEETESLSCFGW